MVQSLGAHHAAHAKRRAANAAAAAALATARGDSSLLSPPVSLVYPPVRPEGDDHLLTPTVERTVTILDLPVAASGPPTMAPSATVATAAAANTASNYIVDEFVNIVPDHFVCPITKLIMANPGSDNFGHSYEKAAIKLWPSDHSTSPVNRALLPNKTLTLNHALQNIIQEYSSHSPTAATAATAISNSTIALRDASSQMNRGSTKKQKTLKPATHSQVKLNLLNDVDWDNTNKVWDMVLKSVSLKIQLDVLMKNLAEAKRSLTKSNRIFFISELMCL
jgi:hypothetical protein